MNYNRIMIIVVMIVAIMFAAIMFNDLNSDDISIASLDAIESVGMHRSNGIFSMQDAFEMDMFILITFNLIPIMMIIGIPSFVVWMYFSEEIFEEDR